MDIEDHKPKEGPEIMKPQRDWKARLFSPLFALAIYFGIKYGLLDGNMEFWQGLLLIIVSLFLGNIVGSQIWPPTKKPD